MTILNLMMMTALLGMCGMVLDVGKLLISFRALQATTDDAALAGAISLPQSSALLTAVQYSAVAGNRNARGLLSGAQMVSGYPQVKCIAALQSQGYACSAPANGNAVQVKQQLSVPLVFMRLLGFRQYTIAASSTARTGLMDLSSGVSSYQVSTSVASQYNGQAPSTTIVNDPGGWVQPTTNGYTDPGVLWIVPPGGDGTGNYNYPNGTYLYYSNAFSNVTAITAGLVNSDDTVTVGLYDVAAQSLVQNGLTFSNTGSCQNGSPAGSGSYCNSALPFNFSGLSPNRSYILVAQVNNTGGPSGLLMQATGYGNAGLYRDQ